MNKKLEDLKQYLQQRFQGRKSFIEEILNPIFGQDRLELLNQNMLTERPELHNTAASVGIKEIIRFATIDLDFYPIDVFEITVSDKVKLARNRVSIQKIIRSCMASFSGAFMIFHYDNNWEWRFTFCSKRRDNKDFTDNKRYTFLLGEDQSCRTAAENFLSLIKKKEKNIELTETDLVSAFSVEALSKRFFEDYKAQYLRFVNYMNDPQNGMFDDFSALIENTNEIEKKNLTEKNIRDYVKKLLGRIVFIQFLQKKGWMGVAQNDDWGKGDYSFLKNLFDRSSSAQKANFLDEVLEPLFSDALDTNRHANNDLFDTKVNLETGCVVKIPYLNGGLFERDELDKVPTRFPKEYFKELLDLFDQYNFTVDENDPNDAVVGVDPEMLGRIFENLLEDNKDKGAFYTPKTVVQFMCKETLIQYLKSELEHLKQSECRKKDKDVVKLNGILDLQADDAKELVDFVNNNEISSKISNKENAKLLNELLFNVKICDPSIGSGAFPLGLLNEIFNCRRSLHNIIDPETELSNASLKKEILQNNIYGVDLEKGAVDIARLRFWLSTIVDEDSPHSLANLDYKIMHGNSLLESFMGIDLTQGIEKNRKYESKKNLLLAFDSEATIENINRLIVSYFNETEHSQKVEIKSLIDGAIRQHLERWAEESSSNKNIVDEIKKIEIPNDKFFLWHVYFADIMKNGGFDIVIGNPPYIQLQKSTGNSVIDPKGKISDQKLGDIYQGEQYQTFERTGDIYCLFYEKGLSLLKEHGTLCYITSNKWMRARYGESLRNYLAKNSNPLELIDLAGTKIFDNATVDVNIILLEKSKNLGKTKACLVNDKSCINKLSLFLNQNKTENSFTSKESWVILSPVEQSIKSKIESIGTPLKEWDIQINYGIKTGCNEIFIINTAKRDEILGNCQTDNERQRTADLIRPILRGRDIKRYGYDWDNKWLIATFPSCHYDIDEYPSLKNYLLTFGIERLEQTGKLYSNGGQIIKARKKTSNKWFETQDSIAYWEDFFKPKIMYPNMTKYLPFYYDEKSWFQNNKSFMITGKHISYLTAFFNSSLFKFCYKENFPELLGGTRELSKCFFEKIQVLKIDDEIDNKFRILVQDIQNSYSKSKAIEIDNYIFELYGLSKEEQSIVSIAYFNA